MEKEFQFINRGLSEKENKKAQTSISELYEKSLQKIEGELEKTPDENKIIELANTFIQKEALEELDVKIPQINQRQIHIFSPEKYNDKFPDCVRRGYNAHHDSQTKAAYFKKNENRTSFLLCAVHEMIHIDEIHKFYFDKDSELPALYRGGYAIKDPREAIKNNYNREAYESSTKFHLFHEAIVVKTARDILIKNMGRIIKELRLMPQEINQSWGYGIYDCMIDVMERAIKEIAKNKNESSELIWRRLKKGLFAGEMMHLRDFEKYIERGLLDKLADIKLGMNAEDIEKKLPRKLIEHEIIIAGKKYRIKWNKAYATD